MVDGSKRIGIGVAQEFLIAKYYDKPVIVVCPPGTHNNKVITTNKTDSFQLKHPFVTATADEIVESWEDAAKRLVDHFKGQKIAVKSIDLIEESRKVYEEKYLSADAYVKDLMDQLDK